MTLIDHVEKYLGKIQEGWTTTFEGKALPFQVARTARGPAPNSVAYVTLGVSGQPMPSPMSDKQIRQEFVMAVATPDMQAGIPGLLQQVATEVLARNRPLLRGEVIGPRGPLFQDSSAQALYVSLPAYFPDEFAVYESASHGPVVMAWLVPITSKEAQFISRYGWDRFEDELVEKDPDLLDVYRRSLEFNAAS